MPYRLRLDEAAGPGLRRLILEQLDAALACCRDPSDPDTAVHEVRKICKKVRAALRLAAPGLDKATRAEGRALRDIGRRISVFRDAQVMAATLDALVELDPEALDRRMLAPVRRRLLGDRRAAQAACGSIEEALAACAADLVALRARAAAWTLDALGMDALFAGMAASHEAGRRAMKRARRHADGEHLHAWRKRVKDHVYHLRLLRCVWPQAIAPLRDAASALAERLGEDHDLVVLRAWLLANPGRLATAAAQARHGRLLETIDLRRASLQMQAWPLGARVHADRPGALRRRMESWWAAAEALHADTGD
ncbi:CHAD domain-containing protein [Coralloluteibacterium stylophorae]|uniref:CHAD domain-containing protein n=1 Tax=Coralloluteibacterium stylophorae TaxID=1776034 RepID=A0AAP2CBU3_9GAMM|nr:CHAD domain-containing protein [Coralloluteibacterium stylophorae]MBS7457504.1 CHAD domain-containing protein [Coralloluteibacterium stylophorae]